MNSEIQIFCKNMTKLRKKYNLTQKEMAKICGIGVKSISLIEKGILPPRLSAEIIFTVANYFNVSPKDMFLNSPQQ